MTEGEALRFYRDSFYKMFGKRLSVTVVEDTSYLTEITPAATKIIDVILFCEGVSWADITSRRRDREVSEARQMMFYVLMLKGHTCVQIGDWFSRDHSTILHGKKTIRERIEVEQDIRERVERILDRVERIA